MGRLKQWVVLFFNEGSGTAVLTTILAVGISIGLYHWHKVWLNTEIENWFNFQSYTIKMIIGFAVYLLIYFISFIVVNFSMASINCALDSLYTTEQKQRRKVKQLKIGDRVYVSPRPYEHEKSIGTVTRVDKKGESFDVMWDVDGKTVTQAYVDVDDFEGKK